MDYHSREIKQLKKHIEFLEFILQDLVYIATTITIDGECFYNIRGPCVYYQKNALKQIYKSERDGQRTEIVFNYPKMGHRCRGQNIFYQKSSIYNNKNNNKMKPWSPLNWNMNPEILNHINFQRFGAVFTKDFVPVAMDANNVSKQLLRWWKSPWLS